jgi:hypothetical protein
VRGRRLPRILVNERHIEIRSAGDSRHMLLRSWTGKCGIGQHLFLLTMRDLSSRSRGCVHLRTPIRR